jgi:hypothetical protein
VPDASVSLGDEAVSFAAKAGLFLDPWQQDVLRGSLGLMAGDAGAVRASEREPKWVAPQVAVLVPRQNGKGSILEARELFGMFVLGERLIIHSAHKFDTSQEHFLRMQALIEGNPDLDKHVASMAKANGKESINLKNGCRLKFKARTISGSGRGFSSDLLILDEAMLLPEQALDAMLPTLATRANPQVWFTSSAGTPDSAALWRIVRRGRGNAKRLAYWEWGLPVGSDMSDRGNWAVANPGLGYRLSVAALEDDYEAMTPEGFGREHGGVWDDQIDPGVFPAGSWDACSDDVSAIAGPVMYGLDVAWDRSTSTVSAAGAREDGLPHMETVLNRPGTDWIVPDLTRICAVNGGSVVIDPASPAGSLIEDLTRAGVRVHTVTAREYAQACGFMFDAVRDRMVRHLPEPELASAQAAASLRELAGAFAWDRRKPSSDITPLVAATLALHGHRVHGDVAGSVW